MAQDANFYVSQSGSDSNPGTRAAPFKTFDKAYQSASAGNVIAVFAGAYTNTQYGAGEHAIEYDASKPQGPDVTFIPVGDGDITFQVPNFTFKPGTHHITVIGDAFKLNCLQVGLGGTPDPRVHDITLNGVHMISHDIVGAQNITLKYCEIGPGVQGWGKNDTGHALATRLDPAVPAEAFFANWNGGTSGTVGQQIEPMVHNASANLAINIVFDHCHIHGNTAKDTADFFHPGGQFVTNCDGLTYRGCVFDHNAAFSLETWETATLTNLLIENCVFGWTVQSLAPDQASPGAPNIGYREVALGAAGFSFSNWLIRYNSFIQGLSIHGDHTNCRVIGNVIGNASDSTSSTGITFDHNVSFEGGTAFGGLSTTDPYVDKTNNDLRVKTGSGAIGYVPWVGTDQQLAVDINGLARSAPTNAGAYADAV